MGENTGNVPVSQHPSLNTDRQDTMHISVGDDLANMNSHQSSCPENRRILQRQLKLLFMNPFRRARVQHRFPWKPIIDIVLIMLLTTQIVFFGASQSNHVNFLEKSAVSMKHLYLAAWNPSYETLPYPPATGDYAVYTIPEFYDHVNFAMERYDETQELAIGTYHFTHKNHTHEKMSMCKKYYREGKINARAESFQFDSRHIIDCFELGNVTECDPSGQHCVEKYDIETFLEIHNKSFNFDRIITISLNFTVQTVHLKGLSQMLSSPDCYEFDVKIIFENKEHNGQMQINLHLDEIPKECHGKIIYAIPTDSLILTMLIILDGIVIILSSCSLVFNVHSIVHRITLLKGMGKNPRLTCYERMEIINLWDFLHCLCDILAIAGSIFLVLIQLKYTFYYDACSMLLGAANLLSWIGLIRFFGYFKGFNMLTVALTAIGSSVLRYLLVSCVIFNAFTVFGWVVFGPYHMKFRSLSASSETLFSLYNGDDIFGTFSVIGDHKPLYIWYLSRIYLYSAITFATYVIFNIFLAIVLEGYEHHKAVKKGGSHKSSLHTFIDECPENPELTMSSRHNQGCLLKDFLCCCYGRKEDDIEGATMPDRTQYIDIAPTGDEEEERPRENSATESGSNSPVPVITTAPVADASPIHSNNQTAANDREEEEAGQGDDPCIGDPMYCPAYRRDLQKRLKFLFMNPCLKRQITKRFPWKLTVILVSILLITTQLVFFGSARSSHVDFLEKSRISLEHLYLQEWDPMYETLPYPPATGQYAVYTIPEFFNYTNFAMEQYDKTQELAIGTYHFKKKTAHTFEKMWMCKEYYRIENMNGSSGTYEFDSRHETDCFEIGNITECDPSGSCTQKYDIQQFLKEHNKTINFDRIINIALNFTVKTVHLKELSQMLNSPDCFQFNVQIMFENKQHDGQMNINLQLQDQPLHCNGTIIYEMEDENLVRGLQILLDVLVILVCIFSTVLCARSVWRGISLLRKTKQYFAAVKKAPLTRSEMWNFIHVWYIMIILCNITAIIGSFYKILIELKVNFQYDVCGILLGIANFFSWLGVLRYFHFFEHFNTFMLTMKRTATRAMYYLLVVAVILTGTIISSWVMFGPYHMKFRTLSSTSETLFALINGDDMYVTFSIIGDHAPWIIWIAARFFLYTFVGFFIYVILNIFLALIVEGYELSKKQVEVCELFAFIDECPDFKDQTMASHHLQQCSFADICFCIPGQCCGSLSTVDEDDDAFISEEPVGHDRDDEPLIDTVY